jgi:hypothetical protein
MRHLLESKAQRLAWGGEEGGLCLQGEVLGVAHWL